LGKTYQYSGLRGKRREGKGEGEVREKDGGERERERELENAIHTDNINKLAITR